MNDVLRACSATTLVPVCGERAWQELLALVQQLWPDDTEVLRSCPGRQLVHAVGEGGEPDVGLTWDLEPAGPGATRVRLCLDEIASPARQQLDAVLVALLSRCIPVAR